MFTINCRGILIDLTKPLVMGIINITPDSFYPGSRIHSDGEALLKIETMISEGADIIDIGGQSTRPGSERLSVETELSRVLPIISKAHKQFPNTIFSIDTYQSVVAEKAVAAGASIVNDISSGNLDTRMIQVVASLKVPFICMHMKGSPENMQIEAEYEDIVTEILDFFIYKSHQCKEAGITDIIIDPGFGFGKTVDQNFLLLKNMQTFRMLNLPIMAGLSRKYTIYKTLGITSDTALNGTTVLNTLALNNGASILRVHDVLAAKEAIVLYKRYRDS